MWISGMTQTDRNISSMTMMSGSLCETVRTKSAQCIRVIRVRRHRLVLLERHVMQIFGLDSCAVTAVSGNDPVLSDQHVVKMSTEACQMLYTVLHARHAPFLNRIVPGPDGEPLQVWKPLSKGHKSHPCYLWANFAREHFDWLLMHGLALCLEYTARFGKIHKTNFHLNFIAVCMATDPIEWPAVGTDGSRDVQSFLASLPPELRASRFTNDDGSDDLSKFCTVDPPRGCLFGILAGPTNVDNSWVKSYRAYYEEKRDTFKTAMRFSTKKRKLDSVESSALSF